MGILQGDLKAAGPGHTEGTLRRAEVKAMLTGRGHEGEADGSKLPEPVHTPTAAPSPCTQVAFL